MTTQQEYVNAQRFGYGIRPGETLQSGRLLDQLKSPDPVDEIYVYFSTEETRIAILNLRQAGKNGGRDSRTFIRMRDDMRSSVAEDFRRSILRATANPRGFRERLFAFWVDHFTVIPKQLEFQFLISAYFQEAIRPNISGRFADLLKAVITHPSMILFLDQNVSAGPNSVIGKRRGLGLNENLAREVLELHTLGVDGGYSQDDVRQFAELLTGLTVTDNGAEFVPRRAEPGAETILGKSYGAGEPALQNIFDFLEDLAINPTTARHLASKFAVHFVGPDPDPDFVNAMTDAYLEADGDLMALYTVLVEHPAAQVPLGQKARTPFEYMISCQRALNVPARDIERMNERQIRSSFHSPLVGMGQPPYHPAGPDGWEEDAEAWITPPALAARINWAGGLAQNYAKGMDPRGLLETVLGPLSPDDLDFAVAAAETKWEGVALMLISPTFMRR